MKASVSSRLESCAKPISWGIIALLASAIILTSGCVSTKYKKAREDTPPPTRLAVPFPGTNSVLSATLDTVIVFDGPGSWKREAFWDEYVVSLKNESAKVVAVVSADLFDYVGIPRRARNEPWALALESKTLEQKYNEDRVEFARHVAPAVLIVGTGAAVGVALAGTVATPALTAAGIGAGSVAAAATVVALPIYYGAVTYINHKNKNEIEAEFNQRRLPLPLVLLPGETRYGSLFFPMVPNPRTLSIRWTCDTSAGESALPLNFLEGIHIDKSVKSGAKN